MSQVGSDQQSDAMPFDFKGCTPTAQTASGAGVLGSSFDN